jgi:tetratricopeptide (TPR) repeat protein
MRGTASSDCRGDVRALARRDFWRRWGRRFGCLVAFLVLSFGAYRGYEALREKHLVTQTREFVAKGDYQSAVLVARRVLQLNQNNVAACRVMAETAESADRGEALSWRQRVSALEPNVPENQLALAATALRFGQIDLARASLDSVAQAARASVKYHELSGGLAIAEKQPAVAESQFATALQLEPGNTRLALNLAVIRLALSNFDTTEKGRAELVRLAEDPATRLESLRALASDALARNSRADAQRWAEQLKSEKRATFSDALLYLEAVQASDGAPAVLLEVEAKAKDSPVAVVALLTWMNRHEMAKSALEWGLSLPKEILTAQPVPLAVAESYSFLQDWRALQEWVEGKNWGEHECFRLAVLSHALHHRGPADRSSMEAQTVWRAALAATKSRPDRLAPIAQLAEGWGYTAEAEDAWWIIANGSQNATVALTALQRLYKSKQDSHGLLRVAKRALELNPADLVAANNCASLGLLLTGDGSARRLATKLHLEYPASTVFSATYAFALHLEGKTGAALKVMETLKEAELRYPAIAAYYFVMLVESGNMERAQSFLPAANQAALLPEEQKLLTDATRKLLARDAKPVAMADSAKS